MMELNIRDFGAKGNGKHDDTSALIDAMKAAREGVGVVYFPPGEYMIHPVRVPSHIMLKGDSCWAYENKDGQDPEFEGRTTIAALSGNGRALLDLANERGTRIVGLTLDGRNQGEGMHGIYARHSDCEQHNCIEDCRINHFTGSGIRFERSWVFAVRRCLIMFNGEHGVDATGGYDGWIIDCQLTANKGAGLFARGVPPEGMSEDEIADLQFFGTASIMVTANRVEWNREGGILLTGSNSMQINGCSIDHNFGPGITLRKCVSNTITGCKVRSNGVDCEGDDSTQIIVEDSVGTAITGNTIWGWYDRKEWDFGTPYPYYGIIAKGLKGSVISSNAMYHSSSKEGVRDDGGHEETVISQNAYVKPVLKMVEGGGFKLIK